MELFMSDFWLYLTCCLIYWFYYKTFQHNLLTKSNRNFVKCILSCALEASSMFQCQKSAAIAPFCFHLYYRLSTAWQVKGKEKMFLLMLTASFIWSPVALTCWETHIHGYMKPSLAESHYKLILHQLVQTVLLNKITPPNRLQQHVRATLWLDI